MNHSRLAKLPWIDTPPYDQVLTELVSLCQKREISLICVQGPNGSGKSRVLTELLSSLSFDKTASLIALSGQDNEVFYHNVQISPTLLNLQSSEFLHNFTLTLEAILKDKQHFYILIDDVEALPHELVQGMAQVIFGSEVFKAQITLVVFMGLVPIPIDMKRLLRSAKIITLLPMSVIQTKEFVDKAYQYMQNGQEISITNVNRLHNLSYGYIGRIISLLESEDASKEEKPLFKGKHIWLIACASSVLMALLAIYSFWTMSTTKEMANIVEYVDNEPEVAIVSVEPSNNPTEKVPVKIILPIQNATEYDAMNELTTIKRIEPEIDPQQEVVGLQSQDKEAPQEAIPLTPINAGDHSQRVTIEEISIPLAASVSKITEHTAVEKNYIIELGRKGDRRELENLLKGRSIPGRAQFKLINDNGSKVWVAFIGPYSSKKQAIQGQKKLPASLQQLPLRVNKEF